MKKNKGITLIALVVTIIVLLIIVGVGATALTRKEGLISKSEAAKLENEQQQLLEELRITLYKKGIRTDGMDVLKELNKVSSDATVIVSSMGEKYDYGKGTLASGDVYYIEKGMLYYKSAKGQEYEIGTLYTDTGTAALDDLAFLVEKNKNGNMILAGVSNNYKSAGVSKDEDGKKKTSSGYNLIDEQKNIVSKVTIPSTVQTIGSYAFAECTSLNVVKIPDSVTAIGNNAFSKCGNLMEVNLPKSITSIGDGAFKECYNIQEITIPASVKTMGTGVFEKWKSSQTIYVSFKKGQEPSGWSSGWNASCKAKIHYAK